MGAGHDHHGHSHHHGNGHGHSHGHGHGHGHVASYGRAFAIGIVLNLGFTVAETIAGVLSGSLALVADAGHNLSDVLALAIAWLATVLTRRPTTSRFTYGLKSSSILAALANAALLLVAIGAIAIEALRRLFEPGQIDTGPMIWVAAVGIAVNIGTAMLFHGGRHDDINVRAAFLHMVADAAISAGVVVAGIAIALTGRQWIDPLVSLAIAGVIGWGTWGLLKASMSMGLQAVPPGIDERAVRSFLAGRPGVSAVHDLHIWPMSTTETALTAHLVMPAGHPGDYFLHTLAHELEHDFHIGHATMQVETGDVGHCAVDCHEPIDLPRTIHG